LSAQGRCTRKAGARARPVHAQGRCTRKAEHA
jgi:hypothetical protein